MPHAVVAVAVAAGRGLLGVRPRRLARAELQDALTPWDGLVALALFFLLPFDIRGYVYYLNYALCAPVASATHRKPLTVSEARPGAGRQRLWRRWRQLFTWLEASAPSSRSDGVGGTGPRHGAEAPGHGPHLRRGRAVRFPVFIH